MKSKIKQIIRNWTFPVAVCMAIGLAYVTRDRWLQPLTNWVSETVQLQRPATDDEEKDQADDPSTAATESLELSAQARQNIGLTPEFLKPLELETYQKTISVPALIVERPGRSRIEVSTPLTGIITHVHSVSGEAVLPGTLLFEIRLTHEDLVKTQTEFVQSLGTLDVENRELKRLEGIPKGAVAGKLVLERQYAIDKLTAFLSAQREALRLHGLNDEQIGNLEKTRNLHKSLQIFAPSIDSHAEDEFKFTGSDIQKVSLAEEEKPSPLVIQALHVKKGQAVTAGESLCELVDYSQLFIEGQAYERDASAVTEAVNRDWNVTAMFESSRGFEELPNLSFAYLSNNVDQNARTLSVFVDLPNSIIRDQENSQRQRFLVWKYRPGQRLQLRIPVEVWQEEFVLPTEAVINEGAESFVFQENGDHFDRIPVHVKYKDQTSVVIANDGTLFPGDVIARRGAHRMQMALKNKAGGVDPHAGHTH